MKRIILIFTLLLAVFLTACSSEEQKHYENALQQAKEEITAGNFAASYELLTEAISTGYKEKTEAKSLLHQLEQYQNLESLLDEGKFADVYETVESISQMENGSSVIIKKAKQFQENVEQEEKQFNEMQATVDEALNLVEDGKYEEANHLLKALDFTNYEASYYEALKTTVKETMEANDQEIAKIQAEQQRQKAEAEKKAKEEAERKNNMLNWTDAEIERYIAQHFQMHVDHVVVIVYDRTSSSYKIEARENGLAFGKNHDPMLGLFEVRADGKLYKQDIFTGDYIQVN